MKIITKNLLWLLLLFPITAFSQISMIGEWTFEVPDENGNMIPVKLKIDEKAYSVDWGMDGTAEVEGNYVLEGDQATIWDIKGENACPDVKGIYKVEVTDTSMTMTRVKDDCEGRGGPEGKMVFQRAK